MASSTVSNLSYGQWLETFFTKTRQPTQNEIQDALYTCDGVIGFLDMFRRIVERDFPTRQNVLYTINEVIDELRVQEVGTLPNDMLRSWIASRCSVSSDDRRAFSAEYHALLLRTYDRWSKRDEVLQEFKGLLVPMAPLPAKQVDEIDRSLQLWLKKRLGWKN